MNSRLKISAGQYSDKGVKLQNEDCCGIIVPDGNALAVKGVAVAIADGVSSSAAGREASESCIQGFLSDYYSTPDSWSVKTAGQKVLGAINRWLHGRGQSYHGHGQGMLTTLSAIVIKSATAHIFHVGDTRIYQLRNGELECLTRDHETWDASGKAFLARAMGADVHIDIDYRTFSVHLGDIYLLTTDGVHGFICDHDLKTLLLENIANSEQAARVIANEASKRASNDNITCQVIKIEDLDTKDDVNFYNHLTELPFPPPLEKNMILNGYQILRELHASKRTQIYLALDREINEKVILKTPSVNFEDDPQYIEQFLFEEWIGRRIKNKHVIKVLKPKNKKQFLFYVTEYVDGITLRKWMSSHSQPDIKEVRLIVKQIAAGLRAFHRLEMLHQDIKPENIMLDANGTAKILDFGSTKIAGIAEITTPLERINLLGTVNYTAPEYLLGQPGTNRSDIFSLGVITYELLTGKLPYGTVFEKTMTKRKLAGLAYIPSYNHNPMVPVWLDRAIEKAVKCDPQLRYDTLSEFIQDISKPNSKFLEYTPPPLMERNPVLFWQTISIAMIIVNCVMIYFFFLA
jgi:serine/threonine protein kinase/serine/threonine protein phosphatase PrpC